MYLEFVCIKKTALRVVDAHRAVTNLIIEKAVIDMTDFEYDFLR